MADSDVILQWPDRCVATSNFSNCQSAKWLKKRLLEVGRWQLLLSDWIAVAFSCLVATLWRERRRSTSNGGFLSAGKAEGKTLL